MENPQKDDVQQSFVFAETFKVSRKLLAMMMNIWFDVLYGHETGLHVALSHDWRSAGSRVDAFSMLRKMFPALFGGAVCITEN